MASRNEDVVLRWIREGVSAGNLALADELVAEDFANHAVIPGQPEGREGLKRSIVGLRAAFSDLTVQVHDVVAQGDRVAVRDEIQATHTGPFNGVPATGRKISVGRIAFYRVRDGKIAEHWVQFDMAGLMRQLTSPAG